MPRFKFVAEAKDRTRRGYITADTLDAARNQLEERGFRVVSLDSAKEVKPPPKLEFHLPRKSARPDWLDLPKQVYRPTLRARLTSAWPSRNAVSWWVLVGTTLSLIVFVLSFQQTERRRGSQKARYEQVSVQLEGQPEVAKDEDTLLTLSLPEIPYSKSWEMKSETIDSSLEFESRRQPTYAVVKVESGGDVLAIKRFSLGKSRVVDLSKLDRRS